ncbi:MAG: inosine/xanthosine triphosphatase [Holophagales bacterium]|nr:inosine/xanthosine triphosphatase [Holophagales bacterium]
MTIDIRDFWRRFASGIDIAVASAGDLPDKILGARDGVRHYFASLERLLPDPAMSFAVRARPWPVTASEESLPIRDSEILALARARAEEVAAADDAATFAIASEAGLSTIEVEGRARCFVRTWAVVRGLGDEAWGSSGALQLPQQLIDGLESEDIPFAIPGTRRSGGMLASITRGSESRREATALATFYALNSLLYPHVTGTGR